MKFLSCSSGGSAFGNFFFFFFVITYYFVDAWCFYEKRKQD